MLLDSRYQLGPRLGRGGMADVHEAWDIRLERRVAIKRFRTAPDDSGLRRFMSEAELLSGLSHPGLVTVFDMSFEGERPFLVLRLAAGGTLRDRIDAGPLPPTRVAEIGANIAAALAYVHERGIVHRDIKPSNVLFSKDGECYLADFGIARAMGAAHVTDTNEFVGTAAYLAPEQLTDRSPGAAVDVYALGLVLLECLTGEPEYEGSSAEVALARLSRQPRIPGDFGAEWEAVLSAMTAADPEERPTAARCVTLLRAMAVGDTLPMVLPVVRRRRQRVYAGVAGLAAAVVAGLAFASGPVQMPGRPAADPTEIVQPAGVTSPAGEVPAAEAPVALVPDPAVPPPAVANGGGLQEVDEDNSGPGSVNSGKGKGKGKGKHGKGEDKRDKEKG